MTSDSITVVGHGRASAAPDLMRVTVSVESRQADVAAAYRRASERAHAVAQSLRANGVRSADIATTGLTLQTETAWEEGKGNRVTGYLATTSMAVVLRDLREDAQPAPAEIIGLCVDAGGDDVRFGGLELGFANQAGLLAEARDAGWEDALAKAAQLAGLAHRQLGEVIEITEDVGPSDPQPMARGMKSMAFAMPIERGEAEISVDVRVRWRLV